MKNILCITFLWLLAGSCKKVEDKFPPGFYICEASVKEEGGETIDRVFNFKLLSSSNDKLELQYYVVNVFGDTLTDDIGLLDVSDKKSVHGSVKARLNGDEPLTFSNGEIKRESRNNYIIEGSIDYQIWFDGGDEYYWRYFNGNYLFQRKGE